MDLNALIKAEELGMTLVNGTTHLGRSIRWVVPTDLTDPRRYLSGGELVLTGMLWRHNPGDSDTFVRNLSQANVAAVGAGDPDLTTIPDDLISACRQHDLPLFHVDPSVAFATITEHVVQRLSAHRSGGMATVLERHRQLLASGGGLDDVLNLVHREIGFSCHLISPTGRLLTSTDPHLAPDEIERRQLAERLLHGHGRTRRLRLNRRVGYSAFTVGSTAHCGWFLLVDDDHTSWLPERQAVADKLTALIGLELDRVLQRPSGDTEFITAVETGTDVHTLSSLYAQAGMDPKRPFAVSVVQSDPDLASAAVAELIEPAAQSTVWGPTSEGAIAISTIDEGYEKMLAHINVAAPSFAPGLNDDRISIGVSGPVTALEGMTGSLSEARHACSIAQARRGRVEVADRGELTSHVLLLSALPDELKREYTKLTLGPLRDYDRKHQSDLVMTLETFLDNACSWSRAAAQLHLHVNTLRYRIERVEKLTGRDLSRLSDRVDLFLALRMR
ncbi:PucR family transcriptional regulator [Haloglycomyces albus]|uniref:PucR family transcriptional regulator n=1 Tax=Haloglycomyces albus TaxID=526067 RepID=UPI00046D7DE9|nr:PucR family transcriptional regulator [Haloglycomyces albus]